MKIIPKYENGGRQDAIKNYKPIIPLKPIKRKFTPTYSEVSPDNKSKWQHQQDSQRADKAYAQYKENQKMQEGLHNLEGFLTFTDYAGLATGVGGLLGKISSYLGKRVTKQLAKRAISTIRSGASKSTPKLPYNWAENWMDKQGLPSYAKPNWQGDALELTKDRLKNGGFDRLEALTTNKSYTPSNTSGNFNNFEENMREYLLSIKPKKNVKSSDIGMEPKHVAGSNQFDKFFTESFTDAAPEYRTPRASNHIAAHEYSHVVYQPDRNNKVGLGVFNPKYNKNYLLDPSKGGQAEQTARGTQIKNYFGLKEGQDITPEMWNYAKKYYSKDMGFDNNMTEWFEGVKNIPEYLKWLNKNAPTIATPIVGSKMMNDYDRNK